MPFTGIFGDPHFGSDDCLQEEFLATVEKVARIVDLVIFNGDFVDTYGRKGKQALDAFVDWSEEKRFKEKLLYVTGGMGHEGNVLYDRLDIQVLPYAILNTLEGRIVIFHGHNVGLNKRPGESWAHALTRLKERLIRKGSPFLPRIYPTDKIIASHTHTAVYDMDNGVFATGPWKLRKGQTREMVAAKDPSLRNIGVFIIVDDERRNDPIKLNRWYDDLKGD